MNKKEMALLRDAVDNAISTGLREIEIGITNWSEMLTLLTLRDKVRAETGSGAQLIDVDCKTRIIPRRANNDG